MDNTTNTNNQVNTIAISNISFDYTDENDLAEQISKWNTNSKTAAIKQYREIGESDRAAFFAEATRAHFSDKGDLVHAGFVYDKLRLTAKDNELVIQLCVGKLSYTDVDADLSFCADQTAAGAELVYLEWLCYWAAVKDKETGAASVRLTAKDKERYKLLVEHTKDSGITERVPEEYRGLQWVSASPAHKELKDCFNAFCAAIFPNGFRAPLRNSDAVAIIGMLVSTNSTGKTVVRIGKDGKHIVDSLMVAMCHRLNNIPYDVVKR